MTLIRFVQRASILAGITFAGIAFHGGSATADTEKFCVVASNGKTACGTLKAVERACVSTDGNGVVCGKFKSVVAEQGQEGVTSDRGNAPRAVVNNVAFLLKGCSRSDASIKCSFSMKNKGKERRFDLLPSLSTMTDYSGKMHKASTGEMGGESGTSLSLRLTSEIDYEAVLTFDNIPVGVKKAQVLSFPFGGETVNLRNITFSN